MSAKNKARKSTGPRVSSTSGLSQSNSTNRTLRQRGSTQVNSSQEDSSDSDVPTQSIRTRNQNSFMQSTPASSRLTSRPSTSRAADSDDNEQSTLRLSNGRNRRFRRVQAAESSSDSTSDSDEAPGVVKLTQEKEKNKPKKKQRITRRKNSSSEASDEDVQPNTSSRASVASSLNQTVSSPNRTTIQPTNMASLVNKCVYYCLIADQKKCSIKKKDLQRFVFTSAENKFYKEVLTEATNIMKKTYGMEIVSSEKRKGEYMLINVLDYDLGIQEFIDYSPQELQKRGFIFYLLTLIFMNEKSITDGELAAALKPLGIDLNSRTPHPIFGDMQKYLKELASQNYVERKEINKDPPQYEFTWGERAYMEVVKMDLLEYACKIIGDTRPEEWILQYNDAVQAKQKPA